MLARHKGPDMPRLTNETLLTHLQAVATPEKALVFTTTSAWTPTILDMLKNFVVHMHAVGRDGNLMVISQDNGTCATLLVRVRRCDCCPADSRAACSSSCAACSGQWGDRAQPIGNFVQQLNQLPHAGAEHSVLPG